MTNRITEMLGIEHPVLAFSHAPEVVAAVSREGGFGIFGAGTQAPEKILAAHEYIAANCDGRPYGVDLILPLEYAEAGAEAPEEHREWVEEMLRRYGVPELPEGADKVGKWDMTLSSEGGARGVIDACFAGPIKLIASALGPPPAWLVERAHAEGAVVAALAGTAKHAAGHKEAGADLIVAQGTEAGGHTGDIGTMVVVPDVVDAVAPTPVVAAGGIATGRQMAAAFALGAEAVWCGSVWLTTEEGETSPAVREKMRAAAARDTIRSRSLTGKPARMLRSSWTDEWEAEGAPETLPVPLQSALIAEAQQRIDASSSDAEGSRKLANHFVGQVVGRLGEPTTVRAVLDEMLSEFEATIETLAREGVR